MFWLLFSAVTLTTLPAAIYSAVVAVKSERVAQRGLAVAMADRAVLELAQTLLLERGYTIEELAKQQDAPVTAANSPVPTLRQQNETLLAQAVQRLGQSGHTPLAADVERSYRTFAAMRIQADEALRLPVANRDPALRREFSRAVETAVEALLGVCHQLDASLSRDNPAISTLVQIKQNLMLARRSFGREMIGVVLALSQGKPWSREELAAESRARGAGESAWEIAKALAADETGAPNLRAAVDLAAASHDQSPATEMRNDVLASLVGGILPAISVNTYVATEQPAVILIGKSASAADDDIVAQSEKLRQHSERALAVRGTALSGGLVLLVTGLLFDRLSMTRRRQREAVLAAERRRLEERERLLAADQAASADAAREVVRSIGTGLERLAAGDLSYRLTTPLPPSYESLRSDLNSAFDALEAIVRHIASGTGSIRRGIDRIAKQADELNLRTEQQASRLEATVSAMDQITTMTGQTAGGADHAAHIVAETKAGAEQSGELVRKAIVAVAGIERASEQIGQIVRVIDSIATQTNLLALNAGIEAARAGNAGRGFAVVAGEVRQLASRSLAAAKQIKELISTASVQVELGVRLVGETGDSFTRIVDQVGGISEAVLTIAASAREQAHALAEVNDAISQLDIMTQQNACMVDQSTASSHELARETETLVGLTGRFRL